MIIIDFKDICKEVDPKLEPEIPVYRKIYFGFDGMNDDICKISMNSVFRSCFSFPVFLTNSRGRSSKTKSRWRKNPRRRTETKTVLIKSQSPWLHKENSKLWTLENGLEHKKAISIALLLQVWKSKSGSGKY